MSQKRNTLTLEQKIEVINAFDKQKLSVRSLSTKFNIGKTQAALIIKNKEELKQRWHSGKNPKGKRSFVENEGSKIDKMCLDWFCKARAQNIPLSGPIIQAKAKEIAKSLGKMDFSASTGWLEKWRKRNNISYKCISGEAAAVNEENSAEFMRKIPSLIVGYDARDIFNADETGLFFRALPQKTLAFKGQNCSGGKLSKERLTILFCASMSGEKYELLVIGKAARPRCFKNLDVKNFPVTWRSNKNAWMTMDIMTEWLLRFDNKMCKQNRKIILFLDNAASHPKHLKLNNIKIIFLPPNLTATCQPLDQGVIRNFKFYYRDLIVKHILSNIELTKDALQLAKTINILDAIYYIKKAWNSIVPSTIKNCFAKAGFVEDNNEEDFDPEDDIPLAQLSNIFVGLKEVCDDPDIRLNEYLNLDGNLCTENNDFEINIDETMIISDNESEEEPIENAITKSNRIKNYNAALEAVKDLKEFSENDYAAYQIIKNLEVHYEKCICEDKQKNFRQSTINNFFKTN